MTHWHVNLGLRFAQPYESDYARYRRCLTANPGLSEAHILKQLAIRANNASNRSERLRNLQQHTPMPAPGDRVTQPLAYHPIRHCPECARRLYHTELFDHEWIQTCPIHRVPLAAQCPQCHRPWPNLAGLANNDCPVCGRLRLAHWEKVFNQSIRAPTYRTIGILQKLVDRYRTPWVAVFEDQRGYDPNRQGVYRCPESTSHCFPALAFPRALNQQEVDALTAAGVVRQPCLRQTTTLTPIRSLYPFPRSCSPTDAFNEPDRTPLPRWEYMAMRHLVHWIHRHRTAKHRLRIYRPIDLGVSHHHRKPLCPSCAALSVWFYLTALSHRRCPPELMERLCPELSLWDRPLLAIWPVCLFNGTYYSLERRFTRWFYLRGLLICFAELFDWFCRAQKAPQSLPDVTTRGTLVSETTADINTARWLWVVRREDSLQVTYIVEDPLDTLEERGGDLSTMSFPPDLSRRPNAVPPETAGDNAFDVPTTYRSFVAHQNRIQSWFDHRPPSDRTLQIYRRLFG